VRVLEALRQLYTFHGWARERVLAAADRVPREGLRRPVLIPGGSEDGSLHATLAHIAAAEAHWLARWQGDAEHRLQTGADFPNLPAIARVWESADAGILAFLAGELDLDRPVRYFRASAAAWDEQPLWQLLFHLSNHTTHHRAEACAALTALGSPPESTDFIDFLRTAGNRPSGV
jgi:uncharacterized damage-inducible protein DinB